MTPKNSIGAPQYQIAAFFTNIAYHMKKAFKCFAGEHLMPDRRCATRVKGGFTVSVRYKLDSPEWDLVTLRDVSSSGMLFNCNQVNAPQGILEIKIHFLPEELSEELSEEVRFYCEVVRIEGNPCREPQRDYNIYGVAVEFKDPTDELRRRINSFVEDYPQKRWGFSP